MKRFLPKLFNRQSQKIDSLLPIDTKESDLSPNKIFLTKKALELVQVTPTGKFLLDIAIKDNYKIILSEDDNEVTTYARINKDRKRIYLDKFDSIGNIAYSLIHEMAHLYQSKDKDFSRTTCNYRLDYAVLINLMEEADANAHSLQFYAELYQLSKDNEEYEQYLETMFTREQLNCLIAKTLVDNNIDNLKNGKILCFRALAYLDHQLSTNYYTDRQIEYLKEVKEHSLLKRFNSSNFKRTLTNDQLLKMSKFQGQAYIYNNAKDLDLTSDQYLSLYENQKNQAIEFYKELGKTHPAELIRMIQMPIKKPASQGITIYAERQKPKKIKL